MKKLGVRKFDSGCDERDFIGFVLDGDLYDFCCWIVIWCFLGD